MTIALDIEPKSLPSGNVTFLMSDIEGSTRLWETKTEAMRGDVQALDRLVDSAVAGAGGLVLKERGEGDSHFCVFAKPHAALQAAVHLQRLLSTHQWQTGAAIKSRIGIHSASANPTGDDYYGPDVNRCARIRAAGHGGQILVSQSTRDALSGDSSDWTLHDLGLHRLLDLSEPQRIYQVLAHGLKEKFAPLKSLDSVKHNLPVQLTSFIGRERELAELHEIAEQARLLTLLGPGGAGKTRTALQLAAESIDRVKSGVWFVDLSSLRDPSKLAQRVIEDLYVRAGVDDPIDAVIANFQGPSSLLLLDNCEHVAKDAAIFAARLLKECPNLRILATSREPLGVAGERAYRLPPMGLQPEGPISMEEIGRLDSVRLLFDRARARGYEEVLLQSRPAVILELCRTMDGIPLALEQVAANLGVLSPEAMLGRLNERLSLLTMDEEGVQARHRTLSAAIDWSYDALDEDERGLFLDLAVFVGGWTLEAAESVCASPRVVDLMSRLVAKSLVWPEITTSGDRRFRLLETLREYVLEKRSPVPEALSERHLRYFGHLAKLAETAGLDTAEGRWSRILDADHSNIVSGLNWALASKRHAVEGLSLAVSMYQYWIRRGYLREAARWFQTAIDSAGEAPEELRADALNLLGVFAWYQGQLGSAKTAIEASLSIWEELGNPSKVGAALNNLALLASQKDDLVQATDLFRQAIAKFEGVKDDQRLSDALQNLAEMEHRSGNLQEAILLAEKALRLRRSMPNRQALGIIVCNLLGLYADAGHGLGRYLDLIDELLEIAKEVGSADLSSGALDVVAFLAWENGAHDLAAMLVGAATGAVQTLGIQLSYYTQQFRDRLSQCIQQELGRQRFKEEREKGMSLPLEGALRTATEYLNSL